MQLPTSQPSPIKDIPEPNESIEKPDNSPNEYLIGETLEQIANSGSPIITMGNQQVPLFVNNQLSNLVWALWNLILSIAGAVLTAITGIRLLVKIKNEDDKHGNIHHGNEEARQRKNNRLLFILTIPTLAIAAAVLFLATQNMRNLMVMLDRWTIIHGILFITALICYIFAFRHKKDEVDSRSAV